MYIIFKYYITELYRLYTVYEVYMCIYKPEKTI